MNRSRKIRVAMIAPCFGPSGGPEVVVKNLTDALNQRGDIDVTLFAPGDWKTSTKHVVTLKTSLRNMKEYRTMSQRVLINIIIACLSKVLNYQKNFDIVHLHSQRWAFPVCYNLKIPCLISCHSLINKQDFIFASKFSPIVSLSKFQKNKFKTAATIWNGIPVQKIKPSFSKGQYLISIGRINHQKGIAEAIKIAKKSGKKLLLFGRKGLSKEKKEYFEKKIKKEINGKSVVLMKEVPNEKIFQYIANAEALLFPIQKPEVCPMVIGEALACGTPIIGTKIAPLPELLGKNKKIAYLSNDIDKLVEAAKRTGMFDRKKCREYAEKYFNSSVMADKYVSLYKKIIEKNKKADN